MQVLLSITCRNARSRFLGCNTCSINLIVVLYFKIILLRLVVAIRITADSVHNLEPIHVQSFPIFQTYRVCSYQPKLVTMGTMTSVYFSDLSINDLRDLPR